MTQGTDLAGAPGAEAGCHPGAVHEPHVLQCDHQVPFPGRRRRPVLFVRLEEAAVVTFDRPQDTLEVIGERRAVTICEECCDVIEPSRGAGNLVGLRIVDHLQAVLDTAQFTVRLGEVEACPAIDERCLAKGLKGIAGCPPAQVGDAAAKDQLMRLGKKLDLPYAPAAKLEIVTGDPDNPSASRRMNLPPDRVNVPDRLEIQMAAPHEGSEPCQEGLARLQVTGDRARLDHCRAFPVLAETLVVEFRGIDRHGERRGARVGTQPEIRPQGKTVGRGFLEQPDETPDETHRDRERIAAKTGEPFVVPQRYEIDVARVVQFATSELAQGKDDEAALPRGIIAPGGATRDTGEEVGNGDTAGGFGVFGEGVRDLPPMPQPGYVAEGHRHRDHGPRLAQPAHEIVSRPIPGQTSESGPHTGLGAPGRPERDDFRMPHEAASQIGAVAEHGIEKGTSGGITAQLMRHFPDFGQEIAGSQPAFPPHDCLFPVVWLRQGGDLFKGPEGHVGTSKHSVNRGQTGRYGQVAPVRYAAIVGRRLLRTLINGLGILAGLIILVLLGLAWRLQEGPIVLGAATPWVMGMIERSVPDFSFQASDAALSGGDWRTTYRLSLSDVRVLDREGGIVFESRDIELDMSLPALIEAELRPVGITVDGARIRLVREIDGNISYALADASPEPAGAPQEAPFLDWFLHAGSGPPLDRLHHVRFERADITLEDLGSGLSWDAPDSFLVIARDDSVRIDLETVLVSEDRLLPLELAAVHHPGTSRVDVSGELMDLDLASLPDIVPSLGDFSGSMLLLDVSFQLALDDELELAEGSFALGTGGGRLAMPGVFGNPVELGPGTLAGRLLPAFGGLEIGHLAADIEEGSLEADLTLNGWTDDSTIEWTIAVADLPVDHLSRYWPAVAAPSARHWIVNNLSSGVIRQGTLAMRSTLGSLASDDPSTSGLEVTVDVDGVTIDYLHGMPPLAGVDGDVTIAEDRVAIETSGGSIGAITAGRGLVTLDGFDGVMEIRVDLTGPIGEVLAVTAREPLSHSSHERFDPDTVTGSLSGTLDITVADLVDPGTDDVGYRFAGSLGGLGLPVAGYQVTEGNGTFSFAEPGLIDVSGELRLNGVPVAGVWRLALAGDAEVRERLEIAARVDEIHRAALGLVDPFASTGEVDVSLSRTVSGNGAITWRVDADLRHLAFGPDSPVGAKSAGEPGFVHLLAIEEDGTFVIRAFDAQAGSIAARAAGTIAPHAVHLDVERLAFGRTDVTGTLTVSPDGLYSITLDAGSIDMVPLRDGDGTTAILPRLKIKGMVNRLWTKDDRLVRNLVIDADFDDDRFESLNAAGEIEGGSLVALQIWRVSQEERRFDYRAENMGDTVRAFVGMDNIDGGELAVRGWFDESRTPSVVIGTVKADRFAVHDAPVLAHLFAAASLPGLANILNNEGLVFDAALLPFRQEGERLTVTDGRLYGQGIRILLDGNIHTDEEQVSFVGTMVPTNPLNTVFEDIPLLGDIITGTEDDGGIFAFTFNVDGPADDPDARVNPLSILAPGILRKLFTDSPGGE